MAAEPSPKMFAATDKFAASSADAIILVARVLIGWLFLTFGWSKLVNPQGGIKYFASLGIPAPDFLVWLSMAGEMAIGITLILGIATRYASLFTVFYLIIATAIAHRYWQYPAAQQGAQYANFCKNLAIMGGALLLYITGAGRFSLDRWLRR